MQRQIKDSTQLKEETENNLRQKTTTTQVELDLTTDERLPNRNNLEEIREEDWRVGD